MTLMGARQLVLAILLLCWAEAHAGDDGYRRILVANRISIDVPDHWNSLDQASRQNLALYAAAVIPGHDARAADLAVTSVPAPGGAIVRVSLKPGIDLDQSEFVRSVREHPQENLSDLRAVGVEIVNGLRATGVTEVIGEPVTSFKTIGGKLAMVIQYRRKAPDQAGESYLVTQYHVPLGERLALITLSRRDRDSLLWDAILERVRRSIAITNA